MTDEKLRDDLFDAIIAAAGKRVIDSELEYLPKENEIEDLFSKDFDLKIKRLIGHKPRRLTVKRTVRVLAATITIMMLMFVVAYAYIPEFKANVNRVLMRLTDRSADFSGMPTEPTDKVIFRPGYIPEGFVEKRVTEGNSIYHIFYENAEGASIIFTQLPINESNLLSIDSEGALYSEIDIGEYTGHLFEATDGEKASFVVFDNGELMFCVFGYVDIDVLVDMAKSIFEKK